MKHHSLQGNLKYYMKICRYIFFLASTIFPLCLLPFSPVGWWQTLSTQIKKKRWICSDKFFVNHNGENKYIILLNTVRISVIEECVYSLLRKQNTLPTPLHWNRSLAKLGNRPIAAIFQHGCQQRFISWELVFFI